MIPQTLDRDDKSALTRPPDEAREASGAVGFGVTAIFLLVFLAVVIAVVVLAYGVIRRVASDE